MLVPLMVMRSELSLLDVFTTLDAIRSPSIHPYTVSPERMSSIARSPWGVAISVPFGKHSSAMTSSNPCLRTAVASGSRHTESQVTTAMPSPMRSSAAALSFVVPFASSRTRRWGKCRAAFVLHVSSSATTARGATTSARLTPSASATPSAVAVFPERAYRIPHQNPKPPNCSMPPTACWIPSS